MVAFDVRHVFATFGGPSGLLATIKKHHPGVKLVYNTVQMWQRRGMIPAKWMAPVLYAAERSGHSCLDFMTDEDELARRPAAC